MNIGKNIKSHREKEGLEQAELAERVKVDASMISHIESGRKQPSVSLLIDISKALHCTIDELAAENA